MNPEYIERITDDEVVFRNYEGRVFTYPLKSTPVVPAETVEPGVAQVLAEQVLKD